MNVMCFAMDNGITDKFLNGSRWRCDELSSAYTGQSTFGQFLDDPLIFITMATAVTNVTMIYIHSCAGHRYYVGLGWVTMNMNDHHDIDGWVILNQSLTLYCMSMIGSINLKIEEGWFRFHQRIDIRSTIFPGSTSESFQFDVWF